MKINRIEVKNFRKLRNSVRVDNLGPGLTVIAGSNEDGKSTLLEAVRCALFQKHNLTGEHADSLQPYGSALRPQVTVDFEVHGQRYTIDKVFCQRAEALLTTQTGSFSGNAAEDNLQEILQFSRRARGANSESEQGIWGLLWVTQGSAFRPLALNEGARSSLRTAIEAQVGQVLGGQRGQAILAAIEKQFRNLFTPTGQPTGEYRQALHLLDQLRTQLAQVRSELDIYERDLQEIERIEARLNRWQKENTLNNLCLRYEQAKQARTSLDELRNKQRNTEQDLKVASAQLESADGKCQAREKERLRLSEEETALQVAGEKLALANRALDPLRSAESEAEICKKKLEASQSELEQKLLEIERAADYLRASATLSDLTRRLEQAESAKREIEQIDTSLQLLVADRKLIKEMERLAAEANDAQTRLDVIATSVEIQMNGDSSAILNGQVIQGFWAGRMTSKTALKVGDLAAITIIPGGSTQDFSLELERHRGALQNALSSHGWETIDQARQELVDKDQLKADRKLQDAILKAQAPNGLEDLRVQMAHTQEQVKSGTSDSFTSNSLDEIIERRKLLQNEQRGISDRLRTKNDELKLKANAVQKQEKAVAALENEKQRLANLVPQLREHLLQARRSDSDGSLTAHCEAMRRKRGEVQETAIKLANEIKEKNPELIDLALEQASHAYDQLSREIETSRSRAHDLRISLGAKGQLGLGERLELLEGQIALSDAECNRCKRRADAIRLLRETMQKAERQAKEQYLLPVTERIRPYLEILFPGTQVTLTEGIELTGLKRDGIEEPFSSLSLGTREQLAVIVRLAFADLLHDHGQPAAVILDDSIAYADADRLDRMLLVLRRAAKRSQILVLTCRERDYERAGAPIVHLPDCNYGLTAMIA